MLTLRQGRHGPLVMGAQDALGFTGDNLDGFHGPMTQDALRAYQEKNGLEVTGIIDKKTMRRLKIKKQYLIFNLIAEFEGANSKSNAWGYKSIVKNDGAGWNYGILQHNRYGSLQTMRARFKFPDPPSDWFGSPAGARGQYWYFMRFVYQPSVLNADLIGDSSLRTLAMLCDARCQGGGFLPSGPVKSWDDWRIGDEWLDLAKRLYRDHTDRSAFLALICRHPQPGKMFAELYPRSGNALFLTDQLSRRRCVIDGEGVVHGSNYRMEDFLL